MPTADPNDASTPVSIEPIIWFVPDEVDNDSHRKICLKLAHEDMAMTYGLKPDLWSFTCLAEDLLPLKPSERVGRLELRVQRDPTVAPSVVFDGVEIVDVEPEQMGIPLTGSQTDDHAMDWKSKPPKAITCKITIADFRVRLIPPKGGLLELGEFNRPPLDYIKNRDSLNRKLMLNTDLLAECLKAMGYGVVDEQRKLGRRKAFIPSSVDDAPKFENLSWRGLNAVEEFARILKAIGHTVAPWTNGGIRIIKEGSEVAPTFKDVISIIPGAYVDRRPVAIILSSAPNAVHEIKSYSGISDNGFQYVFRDVRDGKYKLQTEIDYLKDFDLIEQWGKGWEDLQPMTINGQEISIRQLMEKTAFKRIRLNPAKFPNVSFFALNPFPDQGYLLPTLNVRRLQRSGNKIYFFNRPEATKITAIHNDGRVLCTENLLLKLDVEQCDEADLKNHITLLTDGDITATLAHEAWDAANERPEFFRIGFKGVREQFETIFDVKSMEAEIVISRPELQLTRVNGSEHGKEALIQKAVAIAKSYLPPKPEVGGWTVTLHGWQNIELTPRISKVQWKRDLKTVVHVDGFGAVKQSGKQTPDEPSAPVARDRDALSTAGRAVVVIDGGGDEGGGGNQLFYVKLATDGGGDGGLESKPSYTYIVRDSGDKVIGSNVIPAWQRVKGSHLPAESGIGRYKSDGTVQLLYGDEVANTGECDV